MHNEFSCLVICYTTPNGAPLPNVFFKNDQMTEWHLPKKHVNTLILNALRNQKRSFFEWPFILKKMTFHQKTKNFGIAHKYFEHRSHLIFHFTMSKFSIQKTHPFFRVWHPDIIPNSSRYHSELIPISFRRNAITKNWQQIGNKKEPRFPPRFLLLFLPLILCPKKIVNLPPQTSTPQHEEIFYPLCCPIDGLHSCPCRRRYVAT